VEDRGFGPREGEEGLDRLGPDVEAYQSVLAEDLPAGQPLRPGAGALLVDDGGEEDPTVGGIDARPGDAPPVHQSLQTSPCLYGLTGRERRLDRAPHGAAREQRLLLGDDQRLALPVAEGEEGGPTEHGERAADQGDPQLQPEGERVQTKPPAPHVVPIRRSSKTHVPDTDDSRTRECGLSAVSRMFCQNQPTPPPLRVRRRAPVRDPPPRPAPAAGQAAIMARRAIIVAWAKRAAPKPRFQ
jgi:hypothetical protein